MLQANPPDLTLYGTRQPKFTLPKAQESFNTIIITPNTDSLWLDKLKGGLWVISGSDATVADLSLRKMSWCE